MQPLRFHINRRPEHGQPCPRQSKLRDSRTWLAALRFMNARFRLWSVRCLIGCLAAVALHVSAQPEVYGNPDSNAFIRIPRDADDWTRHFHIGALVGMNIKASFNMSGTAFPISGNDPSHGIFDDGYVRMDNTGNAGGQTAYWGYNWGNNNASQDHPSQYNAAAQTLTMHAASSFSASSSGDQSGSVFPGFDLAYGDNLWYWKHARVGWELGFDLLPINISEKSAGAAAVTRSTYTFNTGWSPGYPMPDAPYQGLPDGGPNEPTISTNYQVNTVTDPNGSFTATHSLDVMLYTLRLGPSFYWDLTDHLGMSLGAGPAVGIVSGDYKYDEVITAGSVNASNTGKIGGTKLVYGGYVNATVMYHVQNNADIFVGAQYMPMSDATISGGGREGRLNLGGQLYFTVGVSWPF